MPLDDQRTEFQAALSAVRTLDDLKKLRDQWLGRKSGELTRQLKTLATLPPDERSAAGARLNALKQEIESALAAREKTLAATARPAGAIDVSLPARVPRAGRRHPLTLLRERIEDIFASMGFEVIDGPELEDDYHNFEALNMPAEHPARDMQDTLYLAQPVQGWAGNRGKSTGKSFPRHQPATLLRTHTSGMQIRHMETHEPPIRIIAPGRVYRRDNFDATHTPMFTQVEGLVVDEGVTMGDLKGTLQAFVSRLFEIEAAVRFRPSFFPYTEPSAELDMQCVFCAGRGCHICKQTGWMEVLGCGMVHPAVFEAVGYDPERYTGFAFGMGIERLAMSRFGIDDIRAFYENDIRLLEQFPL
ncbi:MAG: phenylalanine--tRNA ligase subunit alpha [Vicinamibacterales bacterium]